MPFKESTGYCHSCRKQVLVRQETTNDVLYAILTLFSCGLWAIVWIASSFSSRPWRCTVCGKSAAVGDYSHWIQQQEADERYRNMPLTQPYLFAAGTSATLPCKFCGNVISATAMECDKCGAGTAYAVAIEDGLIPSPEQGQRAEPETSRTCTVCNEPLFDDRYCPICREVR
jgi:hypothetical protein